MITEGDGASHPQVGPLFDLTSVQPFYCGEDNLLQWRMEHTITGEDFKSYGHL